MPLGCILCSPHTDFLNSSLMPKITTIETTSTSLPNFIPLLRMFELKFPDVFPSLSGSGPFFPLQNLAFYNPGSALLTAPQGIVLTCLAAFVHAPHLTGRFSLTVQ